MDTIENLAHLLRRSKHVLLVLLSVVRTHLATIVGVAVAPVDRDSQRGTQQLSSAASDIVEVREHQKVGVSRCEEPVL